MSAYSDALAWLLDPVNWEGPSGVWVRLLEHLGYSALTLLIAAVIAIPAGLAIGHTGRGRGIAVPFAGALRALPTLGLLTILALALGLGLLAPLIALVILAVPPILAGAYAGIEAVDRATIEAARAQGMTEWQLLGRVELPLALPLIVGGLRSAALQVIATWTVAAFLPLGGLGRFIYDAIPVQHYDEMLAGSLLVILLALLTDAALALTQRAIVPAGVRSRTSRRNRPASTIA